MNKNASLTLVGLNVRVTESNDHGLKGLSGKVVLDTRNTITINTGKGTKVVPKQVADFEFSNDAGNTWSVNGSSILGRPEERIAKVA